MLLYTDAGRREEAVPKYLHLHEHEKYPDVYTERERVVLDYTAKVTRDAHLVTDQEFQELRRVLTEHNLKDDRLKELPTDRMSRHVDSQIVELTWLIGHFCLLNRWFTVLQVPDESPQDEDDFAAGYERIVPEEIRRRNDQVLAGGF
jgi:alkylhydroperoxidase family enzyme